jgi:hypothetical protein
VQKALEQIPVLRQKALMTVEKNNEYLQDWHERRWPIFGEQLERRREREAQRDAEADAVKLYHEQRAIPQKESTKGKKAKTGGKKAGKKKDDKGDGDGEGDSKKDAEKVVDGVEAKMRQQMAEAKRRFDLEQKRVDKMAEKEQKRKATELRRIADYKNKVQADQTKKTNTANERRLILQTKEDERARAGERQKEEDDRLKNVRDKRVLAHEEKQLEWLMAH